MKITIADAPILTILAALMSEKSHEFSVDYKPHDTDLRPQEYAQHGYQRGMEDAFQELLDADLLTVEDVRKYLKMGSE